MQPLWRAAIVMGLMNFHHEGAAEASLRGYGGSRQNANRGGLPSLAASALKLMPEFFPFVPCPLLCVLRVFHTATHPARARVLARRVTLLVVVGKDKTSTLVIVMEAIAAGRGHVEKYRGVVWLEREGN